MKFAIAPEVPRENIFENNNNQEENHPVLETLCSSSTILAFGVSIQRLVRDRAHYLRIWRWWWGMELHRRCRSLWAITAALRAVGLSRGCSSGLHALKVCNRDACVLERDVCALVWGRGCGYGGWSVSECCSLFTAGGLQQKRSCVKQTNVCFNVLKGPREVVVGANDTF